MSKFRISQYRYFKYTRWPHSVLTIQQRSEYVNVVFWIKCNLKESQYRINYVKDAHKMFPNSVTQVGYHFKDSADLLAMKLKFNFVEIPF